MSKDFWEEARNEILIEADNNAGLAWERLRCITSLRCSYSGLIELDRNAEYYLYALIEVRNKTLLCWGQMHVFTASYGSLKEVLNGMGKITETILGQTFLPIEAAL